MRTSEGRMAAPAAFCPEVAAALLCRRLKLDGKDGEKNNARWH